jgi:hypothetical protein
VSWEIRGAARGQVWLSILDCWGSLDFVRGDESGKKGSRFPCGVLEPVRSTNGSFNLESRNLTGEEIKETFRIFAAGKRPASRTVSLTLPSLPVIIAVDSDGKNCLFSDNPSQKCPPLVAGHTVHMTGVALLPHETLRVGGTTLEVESSDGKNIAFTVPASLAAGVYPTFLADHRGRSNSVNVQVIQPPTK